jgi:hypothetical protein
VRLPTYSEAVATLALFIALGGTSYAVTNLPASSVGTSQLKNASVTAAKLHPHSVGAGAVAIDSLTGKQINESTLGEVPKAKSATSADSAISAGTATTAVTASTATNATLLGGAPPASYHDGCPSGMHQSKDLCFEVDLRTATDFRTALGTCALAGLRVPSIGEAAEAFNDLGAPQDNEWTDGFYFEGVNALGVTVSEDSTRVLQFGSAALAGPMPYRCVATASD